ncbi:MAG: NAD-dependent epimerase/dehydratase family protein [Longimicrobiales bacterium]
MNLLVLGGTGFVGPHTIRAALERGHSVTMFNRGRTNPELFPGVERLIGDRENDLRALEGRQWDAVLDIPARVPEWVRDAAQVLQGQVGRYLFVSTESVYSDTSFAGVDEDDPVFEREPGDQRTGRELPYGLAKALAEDEARNAFPDRHTIVRPGLIVGPGDPTDRFTYWPVRIERGGEVLAPGDGSDFAQIIDARDLARFMIDLVERDVTGTFNASGPEDPLRFDEMLYGIRAATTGRVSFTWASTEFLREQEVRPWAHMPVWVPAEGDAVGFSQFSNARALAEGLKYRPLAETTRDLLEWHATRPEERRQELRAGISAEREAELLEAWHATSTARGGGPSRP